jgi:hypothetical protein
MVTDVLKEQRASFFGLKQSKTELLAPEDESNTILQKSVSIYQSLRRNITEYEISATLL